MSIKVLQYVSLRYSRYYYYYHHHHPHYDYRNMSRRFYCSNKAWALHPLSLTLLWYNPVQFGSHSWENLICRIKSIALHQWLLLTRFSSCSRFFSFIRSHHTAVNNMTLKCRLTAEHDREARSSLAAAHAEYSLHNKQVTYWPRKRLKTSRKREQLNKFGGKLKAAAWTFAALCYCQKRGSDSFRVTFFV